MSIVRKRSASSKAYIPSTARDNQYILAEFKISDALINYISPSLNLSSSQPYYDFYQRLSQLIFAISDDLDIQNTLFVANDKLVRVRYSQEMHQWQTSQQILFYYDPQRHQLQNSFFDASMRAKKINILFLAHGNDIRVYSAAFHRKICSLLTKLTNKISSVDLNIRIRDHQHLTFDLFAKNKTAISTTAHKFRPVIKRYQSQQTLLPNNHSAMTYAVINLALSPNILSQVEIDTQSKDVYNPLYTYLTDTFTMVAKRYNLNNGALIANGLVPIVRYSIHDIVSKIGELQMLGYNPEQSPCGIVSRWKAEELVDNVQMIFVATKDNISDGGYAKFVNQVAQAMTLLATELELPLSRDELTLRFHQHIGYNFTDRITLRDMSSEFTKDKHSLNVCTDKETSTN